MKISIPLNQITYPKPKCKSIWNIYIKVHGRNEEPVGCGDNDNQAYLKKVIQEGKKDALMLSHRGPYLYLQHSIKNNWCQMCHGNEISCIHH